LPAEFEPKLDYRTRNAMNNMFYANAAKVNISKYLTRDFYLDFSLINSGRNLRRWRLDFCSLEYNWYKYTFAQAKEALS
jgi:hypothetical protein